MEGGPPPPPPTFQALALDQVDVVGLTEHPGLEAAHQALQVAAVHVKVELWEAGEQHGGGGGGARSVP